MAFMNLRDSPNNMLNMRLSETRKRETGFAISNLKQNKKQRSCALMKWCCSMNATVKKKHSRIGNILNAWPIECSSVSRVYSHCCRLFFIHSYISRSTRPIRLQLINRKHAHQFKTCHCRTASHRTTRNNTTNKSINQLLLQRNSEKKTSTMSRINANAWDHSKSFNRMKYSTFSIDIVRWFEDKPNHIYKNLCKSSINSISFPIKCQPKRRAE